MSAETDTPASELERRKLVRLRVRPDIEILPHKYEGRTYYVIKDPVSLRYYRFKEQEHFLLRYMNGTHTLDDAQKEFELRFRPDRLTLEDLEQFGQQLLTAGLAQNESPNSGKALYDRRKKRKRSEFMQTWTNILYIKIPVFDPEKLLVRMLPYLRWMFTTTFLAASITFMLAAIMLVLTHFDNFRERMPSYHEFFSFKTVIYLWAALGVVKVIHEFGHGLSCKAFGGEVHEMGFLFLCFSPCLYANVTDAWTLPNKWHRIIISGAGIYVELMIAAAATFVWWNTPAQPFVNYMALSLMVVCSVSTVMFNGNPLMRFDGYYVLADWMEIPNLREKSNRYITRLFMDYCLGIEVQPEQYMELHRRILFVSYAVISYLYRWIITFSILKVMATFLKPYKLEVISNMLAVAALASMVGWPLFRLGKNLNKRGRLPDMKPVRVTITACVAAALLFVFFFIPLPVSRVRQAGLVQVEPGQSMKVPVILAGRLQRIAVQEGQFVKKGTVLAEFTEIRKEEELERAKSERDTAKKHVEELNILIRDSKSDEEKRQITSRRDETATRQTQAEGNIKTLQEMIQKLTLKAPCDGVVMGVPKQDEIYRTWTEKDLENPFCTIANPDKLRMLVPVGPADYDLIRTNRAKKKAQGQDVEATIRVRGLDNQYWRGKVTHMPEQAEKNIPMPLSTRGGGPLAVKPTSKPNALEPQSQVYLVGVDFEEPDNVICPGTLGQVKIHLEYKTCAWWVWRTISQTFDLSLL